MSKYEKPYEHRQPFLVVENGMRLRVRQATQIGYAVCGVGGVFDASYPGSVYRRSRVQGGWGEIVPAITAEYGMLLVYEGVIEKLSIDNNKEHEQTE